MNPINFNLYSTWIELIDRRVSFKILYVTKFKKICSYIFRFSRYSTKYSYDISITIFIPSIRTSTDRRKDTIC